ncbi:MAG TPA: hypothetical protein DCX52_10750 [Massilia sp.]|nr:hypothetical protein [Massilia sp.]
MISFFSYERMKANVPAEAILGVNFATSKPVVLTSQHDVAELCAFWILKLPFDRVMKSNYLLRTGYILIDAVTNEDQASTDNAAAESFYLLCIHTCTLNIAKNKLDAILAMGFMQLQSL